MTTRLPIAIVGCGNIATQYAHTFSESGVVELRGVFDLEPSKAAQLAGEYRARAYGSIDELLADDVRLVVNLTIFEAHFDVTTQLLEGGKHVYSEKPLAMTSEQANALVALAEEKGLELGCSPFTWLGAAQQAAMAKIREGSLGDVRVAYAEVNHGRIETWHPNPIPFYDVGVVWDVGVYPLTLLTAFFGPVVSVHAVARMLLPERTTLEGEAYTFETPDFVVTMLDFANGTTARLTTSFYVTSRTETQGIVFHGDAGSLRLGSWADPNTTVELALFGDPYEPVPVHYDQPELAWGFGVEDMARRLRVGKGPRTSGSHAAHIVDVIEAIERSIDSGAAQTVTSIFSTPD